MLVEVFSFYGGVVMWWVFVYVYENVDDCVK